MKNYRSGEHFLSEIYPNMQHEEIVNNHTTKSDTKEDKIGKYLKRLENAHDNTNEHKIKLLKELYYQKYIIKELPQNYIELQERIYKEQGYGNIKIDEKMRQELLKVVQKDQKDSLDLWIDYLMSEDAMYPTWFKYYVFNGMITLGKYDKENNKFQKRDEKTVEKFLEINHEIIANIYDIILKEIGPNEITEDIRETLKNGDSFKKLYLHFLRNDMNLNYISNEGIWKKYERGSDSKILCDSLQGKNTGWCTAGYETAKTQLEQGDFYVYYTKDEKGEYTNPRIAIRTKYDEIAEVRGIAKEQNLEFEMIEIVEEKLNEFSDKEEYLKKVNDMKTLTNLYNKQKNNIELTAEELRFLYEIDEEITEFGLFKDPRIQEIKNLRNKKKDLSIIFKCDQGLIGVENVDVFELKKYKIWIGNIYEEWIKYSYGKIELPKIVIGNVYLNSLKSAKKIVLPEEITGWVFRLRSFNKFRGNDIIKKNR